MKIRNRKLLMALRLPGLCELCRRYCTKREPHHLRANGMGGGSRIEIMINLLALGGTITLPDGRHRFSCSCHRLFHDGGISAEMCLQAVSVREGVPIADIVEVMDLLRRLVRPTESQLLAALRELSESARRLAFMELIEAGVLPGAA